MNFRKKHFPPEPEQTAKQTSLPLPEAEYRNPGTIRTISTSRLTSGLPYQRPLNQKKVDKIIREWNPRKLTPVVVSLRDGKFNILDGQHRLSAMRRMAGGKDVIVPCIIHTGMTYQEEAELYASLDTDKTPLTLRQHTKALVESGSDAQLLDVKRRIENAGFTWALDKPTGEAFEIAAICAVTSAYRLLGGNAFSRMLDLIVRTWHGTPHSLKAPIISGMALFLKTYETEVNDHVFVARMSAVSSDEIIRRGKLDFSTNRAALRFARVIWDKYNGQQRGNRKLPYRFE